jgi:SNF2 family DNA or RNA helicase
MYKLKTDTKLLPHQVTYVERQLERKCLGNFDKPGAGKTLEILASIVETGEKSLVICPPHLANNWRAEVEEFTHLEIGKDIFICPYTMLTKRYEDFKGFGFIACDEAHYLKNLKAQRTEAFHVRLMDNVPKYYSYATGTPIANRLPDLYSFLLSLSYFPHVTPKITDKYPTFYQFCTRFCNVTEARFGGRTAMQFTGMKNVEELRDYVKPWTISRDVKDLPAMDSQRIRANYTDDPELEKAWEQFVTDYTFSPTVKKSSALAKAHFTAKYVEEELQANNGPIVVFSDHPDAVCTIERELSTSYRVASIIGGMAQDKRSDIVQRFQNGQLDVICLTIGSSSTGITLTRSNTIVFNDICWVAEDLHQARKRIHRISQERQSRCVYIVGSKIDDRIIKSVTSKLKVINEVSKHYSN